MAWIDALYMSSSDRFLVQREKKGCLELTAFTINFKFALLKLLLLYLELPRTILALCCLNLVFKWEIGL